MLPFNRYAVRAVERIRMCISLIVAPGHPPPPPGPTAPLCRSVCYDLTLGPLPFQADFFT